MMKLGVILGLCMGLFFSQSFAQEAPQLSPLGATLFEIAKTYLPDVSEVLAGAYDSANDQAQALEALTFAIEAVQRKHPKVKCEIIMLYAAVQEKAAVITDDLHVAYWERALGLWIEAFDCIHTSAQTTAKLADAKKRLYASLGEAANPAVVSPRLSNTLDVIPLQLRIAESMAIASANAGY